MAYPGGYTMPAQANPVFGGGRGGGRSSGGGSALTRQQPFPEPDPDGWRPQVGEIVGGARVLSADDKYVTLAAGPGGSTTVPLSAWNDPKMLSTYAPSGNFSILGSNDYSLDPAAYYNWQRWGWPDDPVAINNLYNGGAPAWWETGAGGSLWGYWLDQLAKARKLQEAQDLWRPSQALQGEQYSPQSYGTQGLQYKSFPWLKGM